MELGADVGGTFTDLVAWDGRRLRVGKTSTTADDQSAAIIDAARALLDDGDEPRLLHGTTVATNAILERRGARIVLVTDPGFEDVIEIARQSRPALYDSFADRPTPLVAPACRVGIPPPSGDDAEAAEAAATVAELCVAHQAEAIAICYLHAYRDGAAERRLRDALAAKTPLPISISSEVVAEFREYERMSTTVLNAFLVPEVRRYLNRLEQRGQQAALGREIAVMRSSGGLIPLAAASELPVSILLSGPAGGVVAAARLGEQLGYGRLVSFDMGGTSTDVCRIEAGRPEVAYQREIDGFACQMPAVAVHTVGAGGGSIGWVDGGGALRTGPHSAGASPGPACYDRGGTDSTVTDANLLLGRLDPETTLAGSVRLRRDRAERALKRLGDQVGSTGREAARGMITVVESHMSHAIRAVSIEQGADPRTATLVAFGGAGGLHATALARALDMERVVVPPFAGVFSALGLLLSPPRVDSARTVTAGASDAAALPVRVAQLVDAAGAQFADNTGRQPDSLEVIMDMRYEGQAHETSVPYTPADDWDALAGRFHDAHHLRNGFARRSDAVELVTIRVAAIGSPALRWEDLPRFTPVGDPARRSRMVDAGDGPADTPVFWRPAIRPGTEIRGPAVVEDRESTTFVGPGDRAVMLDIGALEITW